MKEIRLSLEEINTLVCYITLTTSTRTGEAEAWEKLAEERNDDGSVRFPNAAGNARYYRELEGKLKTIVDKLERRGS